jgi:hypothetical protein
MHSQLAWQAKSDHIPTPATQLDPNAIALARRAKQIANIRERFPGCFRSQPGGRRSLFENSKALIAFSTYRPDRRSPSVSESRGSHKNDLQQIDCRMPNTILKLIYRSESDTKSYLPLRFENYRSRLAHHEVALAAIGGRIPRQTN